ncbi:Pleckstrin homology-like domain [Plasmopara halstedii]|uniref:Pleckstrin homology-like domain n=1 Tax=Plasmopara halstedii TaxID=4781 RepID=A0A0P1B1V8_PLAHL|nr:Pleckstrin homology-like domain [Plasmopara halstedii]CEG47960.1 Pleckstrin homology-like domain [Plasmopara halstedii]|eukprot:XP_024584329.1 Pleckstrin homology-like domain [Plasmopara halstedii]
MGLSRRAKPAESAATTSSTSKRFLALFLNKKQDGQDENKRPYHLRLRPKKVKNRSKRSRSRSFSGVKDETESPVGTDNVKLCPSSHARDASSSPQSIGIYPQRSSRSSSLRCSRYSELSVSSRSSRVSLRREGRQNLNALISQEYNCRRSSSDAMSKTQTLISLRFDSRERWRESSVDGFLSSFPRDLSTDIRTTCHVVNLKRSKKFMRELIVSLEFEIRGTKWAAYYLQIVHNACKLKRISQRSAISVTWVICALVQSEARTRQAQQKQLDSTLQHKMTEYRVALQCVAGTSVVKFGRKGKPHGTNLCVENGDTLRWTSKLLAQATHIAVDGVTATTTMGKKRVKAKNAIPLASIRYITSGPSTSVLARALHKDLKARTAEEREWLQRSLEFLVDLAQDHERRVAQQVELTIMKRMETLPVWKYGRKGKPHKTRVFVDRFGEVSWLGRSGDSIQLDEIISVREGLDTPVFTRARAVGLVSSAKATHCFSLVTSLRSLDIEAVNEHQRDWFVVAFRYLLDKVHEKTAAMQRDRAERQLRMLQDLCHEDEDADYLGGDGDEIFYNDIPPARHA